MREFCHGRIFIQRRILNIYSTQNLFLARVPARMRLSALISHQGRNNRMSVQQLEIVPRESFLQRIGIPPALAWGYLGLLLFMVGDGVESGYLSPYLVERGYTATNVAWIFAAYGLMA